MSKMYSREWWKERLHLIQAFADGEVVEYVGNAKDSPKIYGPIEHYSIAPKPRLRPWKLSEVPLGKVVVYKENKPYKFILVGTDPHTYLVICGDGIKRTLEVLFDNYVLEDGNKPCGVEETQ